MSRQSLLTAGPILLVAILSSWWAWQHSQPTPSQTHSELNLTSAFKDVAIIATDRTTGLESVAMQAPLIVHNETNGTSVLTLPVFFIPDKTNHYWTLRAHTGLLNANGSELQLHNAVSADSPPIANEVPTSLQTEHLDLDLKQHQAKSTERVTVLRPGIIHTGVGFEADLKTRFVSFLSKVRSRYDPVTARQSSLDNASDAQHRPGSHQ